MNVKYLALLLKAMHADSVTEGHELNSHFRVNLDLLILIDVIDNLEI